MTFLRWLLFAGILIAAYLVGSVNTAIIISKLVGHKDVRESGSGNAGMTNVMRTMGFLPGIITFLIDASKAAAICALGKFIVFPYLYSELGFEFLRAEYGVYYCGIACIIGTVFPIFFGFKGGKGVAASCGIILVCEWKSAVIALTLFVVILIIKKTISLASISAAASLPLLNIIFAGAPDYTPQQKTAQCLLMGVMAVIVISKHKENIVRLFKGEEKPLVIKKTKES